MIWSEVLFGLTMLWLWYIIYPQFSSEAIWGLLLLHLNKYLSRAARIMLWQGKYHPHWRQITPATRGGHWEACYGDVIWINRYGAVVTLSILRECEGVIFTLMGPVNTSDNGADAMTLSRCLDSWYTGPTGSNNADQIYIKKISNEITETLTKYV